MSASPEAMRCEDQGKGGPVGGKRKIDNFRRGGLVALGHWRRPSEERLPAVVTNTLLRSIGRGGEGVLLICGTVSTRFEVTATSTELTLKAEPLPCWRAISFAGIACIAIVARIIAANHRKSQARTNLFVTRCD